MKKDTILYFEDDNFILDIAREGISKHFPNFNLIMNDGTNGYLKEIISKINKIERVAIVFTDGALRDCFGWDIVETLRSINYVGPVIYTGTIDIPKNKRNLYESRLPQKVGNPLLETIRRYV